MPSPRVIAVQPAQAIEGGRFSIQGSDFPVDQPNLPEVFVGGVPCRVVHASARRIDALIPAAAKAGRATLRVAGLDDDSWFVDVAGVFATELHQVDSPVFD